jgi:SAM-dependent methyltransferase
MYGPAVAGRGGEVGSADVGTGAEARFVAEQEARVAALLGPLVPRDGESVYTFAMRCLGALLPMAPPDFAARAAVLHPDRPLRVLSLCAGAARIEEQILLSRPGPLELTLLDASPDLIARAAERLQAQRTDVVVRCLLGDVNDGLPGSGDFDVVMCVSALHHVANLEGVLGQINARLTDAGELWSVGEQIGRNGNRLWPDAKREADRAMAALPERLRKNARTGRVDATLDDADYSANCFEGIRSEEIEALLEAQFVPEQVYKRNAFLWRLVDTTYCDNYSLASDEDVAHLKALVRLEALHWTRGGRATELYGIYRKKRIALPPT